jgi:hypothetical protein
MTNILQAIVTIIRNCQSSELLVNRPTKTANRINAVGDALEEFIKDAFADTFNDNDSRIKLDRYAQVFSWSGNANNPPDLMLRYGDAIEVKKIQSLNSQIALNSSYPKSKLLANNPSVASACRQCEEWTEKDIVYAIGIVNKEKLKLLWLIYGDCYAASFEYYDRIKQKIARGINEIQDVEFALTNELGRVNRVDPLGITYLRIRGMWGIENPIKVYQYLDLKCDKAKFQIISIMKESKYNLFPDSSKQLIHSLAQNDPYLEIQNLSIKNPDNPSQLISAKIISYKVI